MAKLLMISPAPVIELGNGRLRLDVKFLEGMRIHAAQWDGPVACILRTGAKQIPFGIDCEDQDFGFELIVLSEHQPLDMQKLTEADLTLAAADMDEVLLLAYPNGRPKGTKLVYTIEYTLGTRLRIEALDRQKSLARKLFSSAWLVRQEMRRRAAFKACDGVQVNGYPGYAAYQSLNRHTMLYLDNRMAPEMMATVDEMASRADRLKSGAPLRLVHSGRLEPMKGGQDLLPVICELKAASVDFRLDVFGAGSLEAEIAAGIRAAGLEHQVFLHEPVDFKSALVPHMRKSADVFLSCHRQADPSCTYLESLGCGVPVVGYRNTMWKEMAMQSGGGWSVPMGRPKALAAQIAELDRDRVEVLRAAQAGLEFAHDHSFEAEFNRRMTHLTEIVADTA